jgi:hypothetical protein
MDKKRFRQIMSSLSVSVSNGRSATDPLQCIRDFESEVHKASLRVVGWNGYTTLDDECISLQSKGNPVRCRKPRKTSENGISRCD